MEKCPPFEFSSDATNKWNRVAAISTRSGHLDYINPKMLEYELYLRWEVEEGYKFISVPVISPTYSRGYIENVDAFACWFSPLTRVFRGGSSNRPGEGGRGVRERRGGGQSVRSSAVKNEGNVVAA